MARLKDILSDSKYSSYSPGLGDPDFSDLRSLIAESNIGNVYNHTGNFFVGRSKSNKNNLRIKKSTYKSKANLNNVFHGFLGGIGEGGTFPFIFEVPNFSLLSSSEKTEVLGDKAQYVDNTQPNDKTFIAIGEQFENSEFDDDFLSEHKFRIFISNFVSKDKYIQFPRIKVFDADSIVTHNQSEHKVIEIKNDAVYIYPGAQKRCLNIYTCSPGIKNVDKDLSMPGEVKSINDDKRGKCIRMAASFLKSYDKFQYTSFTNLVRSNKISDLDELDEYVGGHLDNLGLDDYDLDYFKKFTTTKFQFVFK